MKIPAHFGRSPAELKFTMNVTNAARAAVDIAKLPHYSLSRPTRKETQGADFCRRSEVTEEERPLAPFVLLEAVRRHDCVLGRKTPFGQRYIVDFPVARADKQAQVRSVWNVRPGETVPRLVTCYVL